MSPGICAAHIWRSFASIASRARLGRGDEIDLIALDDPAGDVAGIVRLEFLGRKRFDAAHERLVYADRRADEIVVEKMRQLPGGRLPAHVLDLPRLRPPAASV